jgi:hypothetical protein
MNNLVAHASQQFTITYTLLQITLFIIHLYKTINPYFIINLGQ